MEIYLVQHAEAKSEEEDPQRPLNEKGREHAQQVAALAKGLGVQVHQIRHSGKTRARQTAEIMGEALVPPAGVVEAPGLGPVDPVDEEAAQIDNLTEPVMLVGHLPFMERIVGHMTAGDADLPVVNFHNAGIVCLRKRDEGGWQVSWIVTPQVAAICRQV
jgi:phosphohistidine phosphatase